MLARILAPVRVHRVVGVLPGAAKDADDAPTSTSAASASASVDAAGGAAITVPKMAARRRPSTRPERRRFLGYEHRRAAARTRKGARIEFLARFPTPEAVLQVARERVREITARRPVEPVEQTVLNLFLRGWSREHRMPGSMRRREESGANGLRG